MLETYTIYLERKGKSQRSIEAYLSDIRHFANWYTEQNGHSFEPSLITNHSLRTYRRACIHDLKLSPATWNRRLASLRSITQWAQQTGQITHDHDLFDGVSQQRQQTSAPRWLTNHEYNRFMNQVEIEVNLSKSDYDRSRAAQNYALVALMVWGGLREMEVMQLEITDIELSPRKGHVVIRSGKGEKFRTVPLSNQARKAIQMWLDIRGDCTGSIFIGKRGAPLGANGIQERIDGISDKAGIGHVTPHQLRHTFCKRVLEANKREHGEQALQMVAELAGHERLDTTRRYTRLSQTELSAAIDAVSC